MALILAKYAASALVIAAASELAKRSGKAGAFASSLPLVTILVMIWLHLEGQPRDRLADYSRFTFWYVIPTLPMFLAMPALLQRGWGFWPSLGLCAALTVVCFWATALAVRGLGVDLLP